ncbi:hypothetical protein ABW19_dt0207481 [Dactylella cylindrospora]|nr:hypothetical protein ABW19_dt0207481 [Dactylella cylindrospora]
MDRVLDSPFISLQPATFTPHNTTIHYRQEKSADSNSASRCNEGKPSCQGCLRSKIECHYEESIPPRAQPKNRKRPQRKQGANRFVFIEFGENAPDSQENPFLPESGAEQYPATSPSGLELSRWQSAPSTCLLQGGLYHDDKLGSINSEVEYLDLFRSFTYRTLPMQFYDTGYWQQVTFEFTYAQPYLYNIIVAISAAHRRFLRKEPARTAQEISCYVRSLSNFRSALANRAEVATMSKQSWVVVLVTAALLSMYIMSCPVDNFENSFDTYFSLARGAISMLVEAKNCGIDMPTPVSGWNNRSAFAAKSYLGKYKFPGLEYAASGDDRAINEDTMKRLVVILSVITGEDPLSFDTANATSLLKMALEWISTAEPSLIKRFRAKSVKAYLVTAHYYAGLWKIRDIVRGLCLRGEWKDESGSVDSFWWIGSVQSLCKGSLKLLEGEPIERISWIEETVKELERG